ncbi:IdeS/Mac family cysteine endopeptidase [uncultured Clostridium sp.]|uniref:IdeS/Mac family cysteine endopeptidase n=1 Tax=uncultured Clostridium sp. TaxID=59620 RepID=UPI0025849DE6|nr:IdeS/Mac family cysteine endopeptidase [uncultured Clostridium sp.]
MLKKTKIISAILLAGILSLNFSKSLTTYADLTTLNYDYKYDLNNDSIINELDIDKISKHYNNQKDSADWAEELDFNNDGIIDIFDIIKISKRNGIKRTIKRTIKKSPENALEFQNLLAANKNVTTTKDAAGKKLYNVWVKGITPPTEDDFTNIDLGDNYTVKVAPWKSGQGWYDINKFKDGSDDLLCSGAVATNMLHWWFDQNKEYIDRYLKQNPNNGKSYSGTLDIHKIPEFHNQQNSDIFNTIKTRLGRGPIWADQAVLWYTNGFDVNFPIPTQSPYISSHIDRRGGVFRDVFKEYGLTERSFAGTYDAFNRGLIRCLKEDRALGISHVTPFLGGSHIITLWGARFDENGNIIGVYTCDSDDERYKISKNVLYGMRYHKIVKDSSGIARMTAYNGNNNDIGARVLDLYYLSLERDQWKKYFNEN